ncbi:MAG: phosphotransferase [Pseudomonadota bacterium]
MEHGSDMLGRLDRLAQEALALWDLPKGATARRINVAENTTYLVEAPGHRSILRVHREGYHSRRAIACELAWIDALAVDGAVATPGYYVGRDGAAIQVARTAGLERFLVLFHFVDGVAPDESGARFEELGGLAATCHLHAIGWEKPEPFERLTWDVGAVFGPAPTWGDWRDAPEVTDDVRVVLEVVEATIRERLGAYGKAPERYNLIHADMRLANLLVGENGTRLIDFDDCGFGWLMYDFAAAISFIEDDPRVPAWKAAWLRGYQSVRVLGAADVAEIDTLVMLRRMALLAWIGSRIEAPEPQALAPGFAATTARLGRAWLDGLG